MQYVVGINHNRALYTAKFSSKEGHSLCILSTENTVKTKDNIRTHKAAFGKLGDKLRPLLLKKLSSLYITGFIVAILYGMKVTPKTRVIGPRMSTKLTRMLGNNINNVVPTKNIRFQKLSLLSLDCKKLIFGALGLSYIPPYSLTITGASNNGSFEGFPKGAWIFALLKFSTSVLSNVRLKLYAIIISNLYPFTKEIKLPLYLISVLFFVLCSNGSQALAAGNVVSRYSKEHISYLIAQAERINRIPPGLLAAIARQESKIHPYALNINGKPLYNRSLEEAAAVVRAELATGVRNIDIGVMQINYRWHGVAFKDISQMLIPENNINYAASLLRSLRNEHGNWFKAVRYYHSTNPEHYKKYSRKVVSYWLRRDRTELKRIWDSS